MCIESDEARCDPEMMPSTLNDASNDVEWLKESSLIDSRSYYYNKHTRETRWETYNTDSQILAFLEEQNLLSSNEIQDNPVCGALDTEQDITVI